MSPSFIYLSKTKQWTFDAGSHEEQAGWIALIKGAVRESKGGEDVIVKEADKVGSACSNVILCSFCENPVLSLF